MAGREKCPDCKDPIDEHNRRMGCAHRKRGASGKLVICGCTRVFL